MKEETIDYKSSDKLPLPSKRPSKKKPKDKPKRPLSAYNFFFKEEREKILKVVTAEDPEKVENDPESEDYLDEEALGRLRKEGGKVSFEEMGKLIGQRWKNIDSERMTKFSELAAEDTERYKKAMAEYNSKQEIKMRNEALKPSSSFSRTEMNKQGAAMDPSRGAYPDSAAFTAGGYPYGMDFGYGMGMGAMYSPYGGYPGMGGQGSSAEGMSSGRMDGSSQYGSSMYGMMSGGFQGGMMGYG